jgi:hypothetical protein
MSHIAPALPSCRIPPSPRLQAWGGHGVPTLRADLQQLGIGQPQGVPLQNADFCRDTLYGYPHGKSCMRALSRTLLWRRFCQMA